MECRATVPDDGKTFSRNSASDTMLCVSNRSRSVPTISGLDFLPTILARKQAPFVVILSSFDYEEEIYRAARARARGYLMRDATRAQIVGAIRSVAKGNLHFPK